MVHGLTASPAEMRPLAEFLSQQDNFDFDIIGIRLPGHGTSVEDLRKKSWKEWVASVENAYNTLKSQYDSIVLCGLSLGALLTAYVAAMHPEKVCALVLLAPPYKLKTKALALTGILRFFKPYFPKSTDVEEYYRQHNLWSYTKYPTNALYQLHLTIKALKKKIKEIQTPTMIALGKKDDLVALETITLLKKELTTTSEVLILNHSGHILTVEPDKDILFAKTREFIEKNCTK